MPGPESKFSKKVIARLEAIPETFVIRTQAGSIGGIPDLIICHRGIFFAWELKVDSDTTALQDYIIEKISRAGGYAWVVRPQNLEESINQLKLLGSR